MSVRFDAAGEYLRRTTGLPNIQATYTLMGWYYISVDRDFYGTLAILNNASNENDNLTLDADGTTVAIYAANTGVTGSTLSVGQWYHLAMVRESSSVVKLYLNGVLDLTNTTATGYFGATENLYVGDLPGTGQGFNGRAAGFKMWDTALTQAEVQAEVYTLRPQRFTNLLSWSPVFPGSGERTRDYSGNGYDWTETGTVTDEDGPPVGWGGRPQMLSPVRTAQYARPDSDVSAGTWTTDTGGTTDLYQAIDETNAVDADYIQSVTDPASAVTEVGLSNVTDPAVSTGHIVRYRARRGT
jgi:hypothetical protein